MKSSYRIGSIWGIPLKIHISLFILLAYISIYAFRDGLKAYGMRGALLLVVAVLLLQSFIFISIGLHELGHSYVAMRKGCKVREITLMIIGGAAVMENIPRRPRDEFAMAIAGPAVSATLAILLGLLALAFSPVEHTASMSAWFGLMIRLAARANGLLAVFNLLPAFPMDGGRMLRAMLTPFLGRLRATRIAMLTGRVLAILLALGAIFLIPAELATLRFFLILLAGFVFVFGKREYQQVQLETLMEARAGWHGATYTTDPTETQPQPPIDDHTVLISPPPYQTGPADRTPIRKITRHRFPFL